MKIILSALKRIITAVTNPFRMLIVRVQRTFNINVITAKLIGPLTKNIKKLISLRPESKKDYVSVGKLFVYKKLFLTVILILCAGVFLYFTMFAKQITPVAAATQSLTDVSYDYDDMKLGEFSGVANIRAAGGQTVYTGYIEKGFCTGVGTLWNTDGVKLYEGEFLNNKYSGSGVAYYLSGTVKYEGSFSNNLYNGEGKLYSDAGELIYEGQFKDGYYSGEGKQFSAGGALTYEGGFLAGKYHGNGSQYYNNGTTSYVGEFFEGKAQGSGTLYSEAGQALYTGAMKAGSINYEALIHMNLADIETAFSETPVIYYTSDSCALVYEQVGLILSLNSRIRVDVKQMASSNENSTYYYMPTAAVTEAEMYDLYYGESSLPVVIPSDAAIQSLSWYESSGETDSQGSGNSQSQPGPSADTKDDSTPSDEGTAASDTPNFVTREVTLYYEIDTGVWRSEKDDSWQDDKKKVAVKKVTVLGAEAPDTGELVTYDDGIAPQLEECVAVDYIRADTPTAFSDITFSMNKENRLYVELSGIDNAASVSRTVFMQNGLIWRLCRQTNSEAVEFFSIESAS